MASKPIQQDSKPGWEEQHQVFVYEGLYNKWTVSILEGVVKIF